MAWHGKSPRANGGSRAGLEQCCRRISTYLTRISAQRLPGRQEPGRRAVPALQGCEHQRRCTSAHEIQR